MVLVLAQSTFIVSLQFPENTTMLLILAFFVSFICSPSNAITEVSILQSKISVDEKLEEIPDIYNVFVKKPEGLTFSGYVDLDVWYQSFLPDATFGSEQSRLVHSYRHVATGFAANLTATDVTKMGKKDGFISAQRRRIVPLHTTETPSFLGLEKNVGLWNFSNGGKGVIIGFIDTGIAAEHPSFSGEGMPPPPAKWKGKCDDATLCNNKLIGARNFALDSNDTSDEFRHGTHTASTAAGSPVEGVSYFGQSSGTAIGIAPLAHIAMYKVFGPLGGAGDTEILAAMDAAIEDGVDVLSLSLGSGSHPFYDDVIALGAFAAINKGIFVSCSAGNSGPHDSSLSNEAPWILTVGASTVDRAIRATVVLGNNAEFDGESLFQPNNISTTLVPLVYAGANGNLSAASCDSLSNVDVIGKIVLCAGGGFADISKGQEVKNNGGLGMIFMNPKDNDVGMTVMNDTGFITTPRLHVFPTSQVNYLSGLAIKSYIYSTSSPTATIVFKGTVVGKAVPEAPQVAIFSSRGPSVASPGILKPDIIGPGVRVLAAWPVSVDYTSNKFEMMSGTSMACPHLAGIATLLKNAHPEWSPAAIKSAIMTTADLNNLGGFAITDQQFGASSVFNIGAGHVNPNRATSPGLIYDILPEDYIPYLCGLGYLDKEVGLIVQSTVVCSTYSSIVEAQLNYPSFSIKLGSAPKTYSRTVANVGEANSAYKVNIWAPDGVDIQVNPDKINFSEVNQKATYSVTFSSNSNPSGTFSQGYLTWVAEGHNVHSPIAVLFE